MGEAYAKLPDRVFNDNKQNLIFSESKI
jgi:hypothetical protein